MSQPPAYSRQFSFTNFQAQNPTAVLPGSQVDLELNTAKATLDAVLTNLKLIQRDDGAIANASIGLDQLKAEVPVGFNAPVVWTTATAYAAGSSTVFNGSGFYRCLVAHTSGVFATDLAAGKWQLIVNLAAVPLVNASQIAVSPSGSLTTDAQTSLQALDSGKAPTSHTHPSSAISDSTAAGRALLTAADATAQNALLGTNLLGFQSGDVKETAAIIVPTGWYKCDGSAKNRVTDVNLFNAITIQQSGVLTNASGVVTSLTDTSNMSPGMPISGTGVQVGTVIQSVDSSTQITMSQNATATATTPLVIAPYGVGDGSSTFNLPNRAYAAVGPDNASGSAANIMQQSMTVTASNASPSLTVASASGLFVGMYVSHPKIPFGTTIISIPNSTTITLSANTTGALVASTVRFSPLKDAQTPGAIGGTLQQALTLGQIPAGITSSNPSQPINVSTGVHLASANSSWAGGSFNTPAGATNIAFTAGSIGDTQSMSGNNAIAVTSNNTGGLPHANVQPTIVMNYIIKR